MRRSSVLVTLATAMAVVLAACAPKSTPEADGKAYVDAEIPRIVGTWNCDVLINDSSPELKLVLPWNRAQNICKRFAPMLGPMIAYRGSKGTVVTLGPSSSGATASASYIAQVAFKRGVASVYLSAIQRGGSWQISGFVVKPQL